MKKVIVCLIICTITASIGMLAYEGLIGYEVPYIPTISEFEESLNENMSLDKLGLFFYDDDNLKSVKDNNLVIDKSKPIVIFTHGMLANDGYNCNYQFSARSIWQEKGYNVLLFLWTQLADDYDPFSIEKKEWFGDEMTFAYENEQGKRVVEKENLPNYCLPEIFMIYYKEFLTKYDICSPEIRFLGHSMGGQFSMALSSYITTMIEKGVISQKHMFSRVSMLDPFLCTIENQGKIRWLNENFNNSTATVLKVIGELRQEGIPVEYIKSGLADISVLDDELRDRLKKESIYLELDTSHLPAGFIPAHMEAIRWYNQSLLYSFYDELNDNNFAIAASTPTSYINGLYGHTMSMRKNRTAEVDDDILYSTEDMLPVICGRAFFDKNKNGLYDDTLGNARKGIKIELYCENKKIGKTYSSLYGYYQFNIDKKYLNKHLYIKVRGIRPTIRIEEEQQYISNSINGNRKSDKFVLSAKKNIKIINIGLV